MAPGSAKVGDMDLGLGLKNDGRIWKYGTFQTLSKSHLLPSRTVLPKLTILRSEAYMVQGVIDGKVVARLTFLLMGS